MSKFNSSTNTVESFFISKSNDPISDRQANNKGYIDGGYGSSSGDIPAEGKYEIHFEWTIRLDERTVGCEI